MGHNPRIVVRGTTYLLTRRCVGRRFLLRPDAQTWNIFAYCLARAAQKHGILVHAICVMSNHVHLVVTDTRGELPRFAARFFRETAQCLKAHRGIRGAVWEPGDKYSAVALETERAVVDKILYTLANPVVAGLVARAKDWPGLISAPGALYGATLEGERPSWFRDAQSATKSLKLSMPPCFAGRDPIEIVDAVEAELTAREQQAAAARRKSGRPVMGVERVRATDPFAAPTTEERERDLNPTFAAGEREAHKRAAITLREWRNAYRSALAAWRSGKRDVEFPAGTWWMAQFAGARVAPLLAAA